MGRTTRKASEPRSPVKRQASEHRSHGGNRHRSDRYEAQILSLMDVGTMTREQAIAVLETRKKAREASSSIHKQRDSKSDNSTQNSTKERAYKERSTTGINFDEQVPLNVDSSSTVLDSAKVAASSDAAKAIEIPPSPSSLSSVSSASGSANLEDDDLLSPAALALKNPNPLSTQGSPEPELMLNHESPVQPAAPALPARNSGTPGSSDSPRLPGVVLSADNGEDKPNSPTPSVVPGEETGSEASRSSKNGTSYASGSDYGSEDEIDKENEKLGNDLGNSPQSNTVFSRSIRMVRTNVTSAINTIASHPYKVAAVVAAVGIVSIGGVSVLAGAVSTFAARTGLSRIIAPVGGFVTSALAKTGLPTLLANASAKLGLTSVYNSVSAKVVSAAAQSRVMHGLFSYIGIVGSYFGLTTTASRSYALASRVPYVKAGLDSAHGLLTNNFLVNYAKSTFAGNQSQDQGQNLDQSSTPNHKPGF